MNIRLTPIWKTQLENPFYSARDDNTDESKWKARLNSCSTLPVGKGISKKNPREGIVISYSSKSDNALIHKENNLLQYYLLYISPFQLSAVLAKTLPSTSSIVLTEKEISGDCGIWIQLAALRMLYWIRTRSLYHAGLSHRREMQVAIISQVQNRITNSGCGCSAPFRSLGNKWKWV